MGDNCDFSKEMDENPTNINNSLINSEEHLKNLEEQTNFYREENKKMEEIISKINLTDTREECDGILEQLANLQLKFNTRELNTEAITLSYSQKLRKRDCYAEKLKICIKMYMNLNEKITKDIKLMQSALEESQTKLNTIVEKCRDQIKVMQAKVQRYENDLMKFEAKYPWLKDAQFDFNNMSKEIETLNNLRDKKEQLIKELDVYGGLQPDLSEASRQVEEIKKEFDSLSRQVMSNVM